MEPVVDIPVDHSVALDVKQGDYYGIKVLHAKTADKVENLPDLVEVPADSNVVAFTLGDKSYSKKIDGVEHANIALCDKKGRDLSKLASEETYKVLIDNYLAGKNLVMSVNGKTGNITLPIKEMQKTDESLEESIDNLKDGLNSTVSDINHEIDSIKSDVEAFANSVSNALLDIDNLKDTTLEHSNAISKNEVDTATNFEAIRTLELQSEVTENALVTIKQDITKNANDIATLKSRVKKNEDDIAALKTLPHISEEEVDSKIADAMAGEQARDEGILNRIKEVKSNLGTEITTRESKDEELQADYTSKINSLKGELVANFSNYYTKEQVDALIQGVKDLISTIDLSAYLKKEDAEATYKSKAEANAEHTNLQEQITNNIGRIRSSNPNEDDVLWYEADV